MKTCQDDTTRIRKTRSLDGSKKRVRLFHEEDGGFSTLGMVLALLITLSLIFTSAQVYKVQSASANVQNVADAAALAAENQVASFYVVVQVCDAIVLSFSLTGLCVAGLGIACLCTPFTVEFSATFIQGAEKIFEARNTFAKKASEALNKLQKLLPFLAAAQAFAVAQANGGSEGSYIGCAVLLPFEGEEIEIPELEGSEELMDDIESEKDEIAEAADAAEDAAEEADRHKRAAFEADCGNNPGYCMYQRAQTLAGMSGSNNPYYSSVDAWSFSVALRRAKAYYAARLNQESPVDSSVKEQANSALRKHFYAYACNLVGQGYVHEDEEEGSFDAFFPKLPRNTAQMRETTLYTEQTYPITADGEGVMMMHAWSGCPKVQELGSSGSGSIAQLESGSFKPCPACDFSASSMGKVAAASSSIENGFEYHYLIVADEASAYQAAMKRLAPQKQKVKSKAGQLFEDLESILKGLINVRIEVSPPGQYGAIAIVANTTSVSANTLFPSGFVSSSGSLGARAAVSAASLAQDDSDETESVISSLLDSFEQKSGGIGGISIVLNLWSDLLRSYTKGQEALTSGVEAALGRIPFAGKSGLGKWASGLLEDFIEDLGLQPAQLNAYKPVLVNSSYVLEADSSALASSLLAAKTSYIEFSSSGSAFSGLSSLATSLSSPDSLASQDRLVIARVEILGSDGFSQDLSIALPQSALAPSALGEVIGTLCALASNSSGVRVWE